MKPFPGPAGNTRRTIAVGVVLAAAYITAAKLGFLLAFAAEQVTTVWAPTGIAQAALLLWGRALWPAVWIGAFVANAGANLPPWAAAGIATGNTLEALAAVWLLRALPSFDVRLRRLRDAVAFIILGSLVTTAISATIGVSMLCLSSAQPWSRFP